MHNRIVIEEEKEFTFQDYIHLVARAVRSLAHAPIDADEVVYSRDDVYFTIVDVLDFLNTRTPGKFSFDQTSFEHYMVRYIADAPQKQKAEMNLKHGLAMSAIRIKETSGKYPTFAQKDSAVMELIKSLEKAPKKDKPRQTPDAVIENRAYLAIKLRERNGVFPEWVKNDSRIEAKIKEILQSYGDGYLEHLEMLDTLLQPHREDDNE